MRGYSRLVSSHATSYYRLLSPNGVLAHAGNMYAAMPTYHLVPTYHFDVLQCRSTTRSPRHSRRRGARTTRFSPVLLKMILRIPIPLFLAFLPLATATTTRWPPRQPHSALPICTEGTLVPNLWSITDLSVHYTDDETIRQGSAQFKLTNTQTKRSETLRCDLRYNYNCEFLGTPHDREVRVWFQANVADVSVTVAAPWRCDSGGRGRGVWLRRGWCLMRRGRGRRMRCGRRGRGSRHRFR